MIEKEYKVLLSEQQYTILCDLLELDDGTIQVNHYYDNDLLELADLGATIRIREKNNALKMQIKIPIEENRGLHIKKEIERQVDKIPSTIMFFALDLDFTLLNDNLSRIGSLTTLRKTYHFNNDIKIALDKNEYLQKIDYELEIEFKDNLTKEVKDILHAVKISFDEDAHGKYSRFINAYKKITQSEDCIIIKRILDSIENVKDAKIDLDMQLVDLGVTSLSFVKIMVDLESEYGYETDDEMLLMPNGITLREIVDYVKSKMHI